MNHRTVANPEPVEQWLRLMTTGQGWAVRAACRDVADPEMFFASDIVRNCMAVALCGRCPVRAECLDYALVNGIRHGIWGGLRADERRHLRKGAA